MITYVVVFAVYLSIMVGIGFKFYNKTDNLGDYLLGGRSLGSWLTALSAQAADMSGWLLIGLPGTAYILWVGTSEAIWTAVGLILGTYLNWLFVAKKLRKYTEISGNSITLPDFFENRFKDSKHILRIVSAVFIVVFFLVYTSSQFSAAAKLFSTVFGMNYTIGLIIGAVVIVSYTALGGFAAVCWTDSIQGAIMFFALLAVPFMTTAAIGGMDEISLRLTALTSETLSFFPMSNGSINGLLLASSLGWGLGYFGQPHILTRFMAIQSPDMIRKSRHIAMIWVVVTLAAACAIGVIGKAYAPDLADGETVFMFIIDALFPDVVAGILLTAILAAIMSTASSQLLVTASSVSRDLYALLFKKDVNGKEIVWISRITVVIIAVIAALIALDANSSVFALVSCAWGGLGAAFGPIILFSLFWKRMTLQGAIAGMIAGGVIDLFWYSMKGFGGIFAIYEIIPGFIAAIIAILAVSLATRVPKEVESEFEEARKPWAKK
ncbi:MAG: sodium/proline symporter PutP [Clostridiales Family XIII bacterium]|jgi:sodium/proline symporter|nr:sodium/proline symporter PutP [Clostridiales Family XIII bacterium]